MWSVVPFIDVFSVWLQFRCFRCVNNLAVDLFTGCTWYPGSIVKTLLEFTNQTPLVSETNNLVNFITHLYVICRYGCQLFVPVAFGVLDVTILDISTMSENSTGIGLSQGTSRGDGMPCLECSLLFLSSLCLIELCFHGSWPLKTISVNDYQQG